MRWNPLQSLFLLPLLTVMAAPAAAQGTPIGFEEEFALATDRALALEQLIPGTQEYYYYHCLHHQNTGAFDEVGPLLDQWINRHGRGEWVEEIENRQALLTFDRNPGAALAFLRQRLGLRFSHQREVSGGKPDLPTRLDPRLISPAALTRRALERHRGSLDGFRDSALLSLIGSDFDDDLLMSLLRRLERPDLPNLPALVVRNLRHRQSDGFGSLDIHEDLLLDQLEECVRLAPDLLNETGFIHVYLERLAPNPDVQWRYDVREREAYLQRLEAFTDRLAPAHNSLAAHVLHHRLVHDLALGKPDRERFMAYLRLPRDSGYVNPKYLRRRVRGDQLVDPERDYPTELDSIGNDEQLVRAYLAHFFASEDSYAPYAEYVREDYLKRLFAETKILAGSGDMERWYSLLDDPAYYEALKQRVEIEFPPTQRTYFATQEPVTIDVDLKNVDTLLVKVFEINTLNFHVAEEREVDASINLDGLVPNEEHTFEYEVNPLRRVQRQFSFPALERPGTYVVEFIGNGTSSRAVIRKGRLQYLARLGAAGHVFKVFDESGRHLRDASIHFGGREYPADDSGEVLLPYSTDGDRRAIVLSHGPLSTLEDFQHREERYALRAGIFLERETLLTRQKAKIVVRPRLALNGEAVSLELLEDPLLTITSHDRDGVASTLDVRDLELSAEQELVHEIQVPQDLASLSVSLRGRVRSLSRGETLDLESSSARFLVSAIDATAQTSSPLLGHTASGYVLDVLGKSGEPKVDRAVEVTLTHRDYTDPLSVTLKTDGRGRIELGDLEGITHVQASGLPDGFGAWTLPTPTRDYPTYLQGVAGHTIRVPYQGSAAAVSRSVASLLEVRGGAFVRDRRHHLALVDGFLELRDLPAGDYDLWLEEIGRGIGIMVTAGEARQGWAFGRDRILELAGRGALHVTRIDAAGEELLIQLANAREDARVHVVTTRYLTPFDPFRSLAVAPTRVPWDTDVVHPESTYHSGREIGDEYRYILERRYAKKFPGNMLRRPGLILNPWALEETRSAIGMGGGAGGSFGGKKGARASAGGGASAGPSTGRTSSPGIFPNLDFLPEPAVLLTNLRPDGEGLVRVPLAELGPGQLVHAVAVDQESTVYACLPLAERSLEPRDRRLPASLDPERHLTQQRAIEFVDAGETTVVEDVSTSEAQTFDSLAGVFQLLQTLGGAEDLGQFAFLLRWPELSEEERAELYSRYACHELHFFLHQKDPTFFDEVIRPYLAHKAHKTFLDQWLLEEDLSGYLDPWAFARLNVVERILLARRIEGEGEAGARHLRELLELVPPDPVRDALLFETALAGAAMDTAPSLGTRLAAAGELARAALEPAASAAAPGGPASPGPARPKARGRKRAEELKEELAADFEEEGLELADKDAGRMDDLARRKQLRQLYRAPEQTRQYVEHNYWHRRIEEQDGDLIDINAFWLDFAGARPGEPFFSVHFPQATGNFAEMMLALAVLDLPFEAGEHTIETEGKRLSLSAASPLLMVRKQIREAGPAAEALPLLISQDFFRLDDRYHHEGNQRHDKYVTGEFLVDVAYGCRVVLTNPTSSPRDVELLLQIPQGALPVQGGFETRGLEVRVEPYGTQALEFAFYFPGPGDFAHYPAHVGRDGALIASVEPVRLEVVTEPSSVDTGSWEYLSQNGSPEEVLTFLEGANPQRLDLAKIAWRMRDRSFFEAVVSELRRRHVYDHVLWSYGLHHGAVPTAREYLRHAGGFLSRCGSYLDSPLVTIDPVERRAWQMMEYEPLFNPRAHRFGRQRVILNHDLARQYRSLMEILAYRPRLDSADWMTVTYYLLLQDRVEEALASFARVDRAELPWDLQYDYMRAYLDFFSEEHALARGIAERYRDYPVKRWRGMFREVLSQLDEAQGAAPEGGDPDDRTQRQTALAASEPALELTVEARRVTVGYQNLKSCEVSYYEMDIEFLFSTSPFVQQGSGSFSYVRPNRTDRVPLPAEGSEVVFDLPRELQSANVLVEVRGEGIVRRQAYYANALAVQMIESYGQLTVTHEQTGKPLPRVYVKVFSRTGDGSVRFYKDGYTDLRGRFDYASLSGQGGGSVERFAILVLSESDGAVIREVAPPTE